MLSGRTYCQSCKGPGPPWALASCLDLTYRKWGLRRRNIKKRQLTISAAFRLTVPFLTVCRAYPLGLCLGITVSESGCKIKKPAVRVDLPVEPPHGRPSDISTLRATLLRYLTAPTLTTPLFFPTLMLSGWIQLTLLVAPCRTQGLYPARHYILALQRTVGLPFWCHLARWFLAFCLVCFL